MVRSPERGVSNHEFKKILLDKKVFLLLYLKRARHEHSECL